jgi:hypothetical protein
MKNIIKSLFAVLLLVVGFSTIATAQRNVKVTESFQYSKSPANGSVLVSDATGKATWGNATNTAARRYTPATRDTITPAKGTYSILKPSGTIGRVYLRLPSSPRNGDFIEIKTTAAIDTVSYLNGTRGASLKNALSATDYQKAVYSSVDSTWY